MHTPSVLLNNNNDIKLAQHKRAVYVYLYSYA